MDSEWIDGQFLGLAETSSEAYIGTATGVEKANDFRLVVDEPYNIDDIINFKTSVREYVEGVDDESQIAFPPTDPTRPFIPEPTAARRMRVNPEVFRQHGYTTDCPGCVSLRDGTSVRARRNHSDECRTRMEGIPEHPITSYYVRLLVFVAATATHATITSFCRGHGNATSDY